MKKKNTSNKESKKNNNKNETSAKPGKKDLVKNLLTIVLLFVFTASVFALFDASEEKPKEITLSELAGKINEEKVKQVVVKQKDSTIEIELTDGVKEVSRKDTSSSLEKLLREDYNVENEKISKANISIIGESGAEKWARMLLPILLPLLLIGFLLWMMMGQAQKSNIQAMTFGRSTARFLKPGEKKKRTTFKDVAGVREAKEELKEIVEFLKSPKKFLDLGARIPRGVILLGPPGTGKTLLAKAVAGEADVPFFNISGSEFVEMFVGVGASRVRDLFKTAKKNAPSILFIDEIDAVGRHRGAGLGGGHDEREQTLNQILVEMDGFDTETNVIVIAATNRPDVLDPALLRPGRFDRRVMIDLPDIKDREAIMKVHAKNKPLSKDVDLRKVAERTPGFSGADLYNLLNEGAILAARRNKKVIENKEVLEAVEKVMLGPERKSNLLLKREKKITAYHEAGHALLGHLLPNTDPIHKISIVSRGRAAGYTLNLPTEDKHLHSKSEFVDNLAMLLGGYAAEKIVFNDLTTGASNDLSRASVLSRELVTKYGMSEKLGPIVFGQHSDTVFLGKEIHEQRNYSEQVAADIDHEVERFINDALKTAIEVINKNKDKLDKIANKLIEIETIEKEEFEKLMEE
ncbi:ATP-dependent zinc metalloprotease FtsH [Candidatus Parcubacteria bacterium]|nr:ATP-dependent zinc metalloprotease FtsH [Candidatus Parcubacteria bacterium]